MSQLKRLPYQKENTQLGPIACLINFLSLLYASDKEWQEKEVGALYS